MKKNKRGLSTLIVTVFLVLLTLSIASIIYMYSKNMLSNAGKEGVTALAKTECPKKYSIELNACLNKSENSLHIDVINLQENISAGTILSLESDTTKILTFLDTENYNGLAQGQGNSVVIKPRMNLTEFNLKNIRLMPVFTVDNIRVLCEDLDEIAIQECT
jgi:hypothetical protein